MCSALKESCQVSFRICHSNASNGTNYCPQTTKASGAGVGGYIPLIFTRSKWDNPLESPNNEAV